MLRRLYFLMQLKTFVTNFAVVTEMIHNFFNTLILSAVVLSEPDIKPVSVTLFIKSLPSEISSFSFVKSLLRVSPLKTLL